MKRISKVLLCLCLMIASSGHTALAQNNPYGIDDECYVLFQRAEAIFDRFTKLNSFVQGTGLGLSICREIATLMGVNVYLDTTYTGGGARFVFEVPCTQTDK